MLTKKKHLYRYCAYPFKLTFDQFLIKCFSKFLLFRNFVQICSKFLFFLKIPTKFFRLRRKIPISNYFRYHLPCIQVQKHAKQDQKTRLRRKIYNFLGFKFLFFEIPNQKVFKSSYCLIFFSNS